MMIVSTSRFGEIELDEGKLVVFPEGIPGFEGQQRFIVLKLGLEETPFWWLQNADMADLCFLTVEPTTVFPEYDFRISSEHLQLLEIEQNVDTEALAIVTVPDGDLGKATVNLKAPILINGEACLGAQIILEQENYRIRQPLFPKAEV